MNLTTLKQSQKLKEWGAPQNTERWWTPNVINQYPEEPSKTFSLTYEKETQYDIAAYDLESLIEWLGDKFYSLRRQPFQFFASNGKGKEGFSKSPLEAVFNLAEAIYEKKIEELNLLPHPDEEGQI